MAAGRPPQREPLWSICENFARTVCARDLPGTQTVSKRPRETRDRLQGLEAQFGSGEGDDKARTGFLPSGHVERDAVNDVVVVNEIRTHRQR